MMTELLSGAGYDVIAVRDGGKAVEAHRCESPDLIVLDVEMPRMGGHQACREIRKTDSRVPILFFTSFDSEANELKGLGLGADDFIAKTASPGRILARVASALRRVARDESGNFRFGEGYVDAAAQTFVASDRTERLTEREVLILREFVEHRGEVLTKDWLLTRVAGVDYEGDPRLVDKIIERLRAKLGPSGRTLATVPRQGLVYLSSP